MSGALAKHRSEESRKPQSRLPLLGEGGADDRRGLLIIACLAGGITEKPRA